MGPSSTARRVAVAGTLVVTAYAVLAGLQILVLNPSAAVPGRTLGEIETAIAREDESLGTPGVLFLLALGLILGLGLLVSAWRSRNPDPRPYARGYLVLLALGAPAYWFTSFGPGMALADSFGISGADHSPWAIPLYIVSAVALVMLIAVMVTSRRPAASP